MPATARVTPGRRATGASTSLPRGIGQSSLQISESAGRSLRDYYGASEMVQYAPPVVTLDIAGYMESIAREGLKETLSKLQKMTSWNEGWDGYGAPAPEMQALAYAHHWLVQLYLAAADLARIWISPNVTAGADGEVVFEWWYGTKKITVYVSAQGAEYVRVWGTNIETEMADGDAASLSACQALWLWLTSR